MPISPGFRACYRPLAAHLWPWFTLWPLRSIGSSDSSLPRPSHLSFEAPQARNSLGSLRMTDRAVQARVGLEMGQSNITQMHWHIGETIYIPLCLLLCYSQSICRLVEILQLCSPHLLVEKAPHCLVTWTPPLWDDAQ